MTPEGELDEAAFLAAIKPPESMCSGAGRANMSPQEAYALALRRAARLLPPAPPPLSSLPVEAVTTIPCFDLYVLFVYLFVYCYYF